MLRGRNIYLAQIVLVVFPCVFLFGYNQVVVRGLLFFESWTKTFPQLDTKHATGALKTSRSLIQGIYVSSFALGALLGSSSCSAIGDVLGRRKTIGLGAILTFIGKTISCTSLRLPQLFVGRIITGMGIGIFSTMLPGWQSESSQAPTNRSVLSIVLTSSILFFPESPRWLLRVGHVDRARSELARIRDIDIDNDGIVREIASIEFSLEETARNATSINDIFPTKEGKLIYRFMLGLGLQFWIQMTGAQVISTYSTTIFQNNLNLSDGTTRILAASALTWKCLASFIALFTIDRFDRRKSFLFCGVGITLCMMSMAITSSFSRDNRAAAIASTLFVFLFNFFFPIGLLGSNFFYCTEVAPPRLRVAMASLSISSHWLWDVCSGEMPDIAYNSYRNFVVQLVTPVALANIKYRYYLLYTATGFTYTGSVCFFYPKTMRQSLEKLEDLFQQDLSIFETVRRAGKLSAVKDSENGHRVELKAQVEQIENSQKVST